VKRAAAVWTPEVSINPVVVLISIQLSIMEVIAAGLISSSPIPAAVPTSL
jgi:hypothetical protein